MPQIKLVLTLDAARFEKALAVLLARCVTSADGDPPAQTEIEIQLDDLMAELDAPRPSSRAPEPEEDIKARKEKALDLVRKGEQIQAVARKFDLNPNQLRGWWAAECRLAKKKSITVAIGPVTTPAEEAAELVVMRGVELKEAAKRHGVSIPAVRKEIKALEKAISEMDE